jgi:hypothetical protein
MKRIEYAIRFEGTGVPGDAEGTLKVSAKSTGGPAPDPALGADASFESSVTMNNETTFGEDGTITFGDKGSLTFSTVGRGIFTPSAQEGFANGAVIWKVEDGTGALAGATGYITSNFVMNNADGSVVDNEFGVLFVP